MRRSVHRYQVVTRLTDNALNDSNYRDAALHSATAANLSARAWPWNRQRTRTHRTQAVLLLAVETCDEAAALGRGRLNLPTAVAILDLPTWWAHNLATRIERVAGRTLDVMSTQDRETIARAAGADIHRRVLPVVGDEAANVLTALRDRYLQRVGLGG